MKSHVPMGLIGAWAQPQPDMETSVPLSDHVVSMPYHRHNL